MQHQNVKGVTLVELMVSLVIGLVIIAAASTMYVYSKNSYRSISENSQMEDNGRFALNLLVKYIQGAGYVMTNGNSPGIQTPMTGKMRGCDFGYLKTSAITGLADLGCRAVPIGGKLTSASIFLQAETDPPSTAPYRGFDCIGDPAIAAPPTFVIRSYFTVTYTNVETPGGIKNIGQLSCIADRTPAGGPPDFQSQPLVPGIEQIAFTYFLPSVADPTVAQTAQNAAAIEAAGNWENVSAVEICVLAKTIQVNGNDTGAAYTDCYGTALPAATGVSYRTFRSLVRLRNSMGANGI